MLEDYPILLKSPSQVSEDDPLLFTHEALSSHNLIQGACKPAHRQNFRLKQQLMEVQ